VLIPSPFAISNAKDELLNFMKPVPVKIAETNPVNTQFKILFNFESIGIEKFEFIDSNIN
jgi:hypothetical protein